MPHIDFLDYIQRELQISLAEIEAMQQLIQYKPRVIAKNDSFLRVGQVCTSIAFIESGTLLYFRENENADKHVCDVLFEGAWATYLQSLVTKTPSDMTIQALEETHIVEIQQDNLNRLFEQFPQAERLSRKLTEESFIQIAQRMAGLQFLTSEERYTTLMKEDPRLIERVPQYYLASLLGIAPQSLSRIRKELSK
jgi:CRP/FNR family transcriptional regulator, anaerobic regulatory protein